MPGNHKTRLPQGHKHVRKNAMYRGQAANIIKRVFETRVRRIHLFQVGQGLRRERFKERNHACHVFRA